MLANVPFGLQAPPGFWPALSQTLLTAAAVGGVLVAFRGLQTWREQLHGAAHFELARRVLRGVYEIRDEIRAFRSPLMIAGEIEAAHEAVGLPAPVGGLDDQTLPLVYNQRWRRVQTAMSDLRVSLLEAEVLWPSSIPPLTAALDEVLGTLFGAAERHLVDPTAPRNDPDALKGYQDNVAIIRRGSSHDGFADKVQGVVNEFESMLRPHLGQK